MTIVRLTGLGLLLACCGCGGSEHEALIQEQIQCFEEVADILGGITDGESAVAARPELMKAVQRVREQNARGARLPVISAEAREAMMAKHEAAWQTASRRFNDARRRASAIPGAAEIVAELDHALKQLAR
jgi:hypothetical protein